MKTAVFRVVLAEREVAEFDDGVDFTNSTHHSLPLVEVLFGTEFHVVWIFAVVETGMRNPDDQCPGFGVAHVFLYGAGPEIYQPIVSQYHKGVLPNMEQHKGLMAVVEDVQGKRFVRISDMTWQDTQHCAQTVRGVFTRQNGGAWTPVQPPTRA